MQIIDFVSLPFLRGAKKIADEQKIDINWNDEWKETWNMLLIKDSTNKNNNKYVL